MQCPNCDRELPADAGRCPNCGFDTRAGVDETFTGRSTLDIAVGFAIGLAASVLVPIVFIGCIAAWITAFVVHKNRRSFADGLYLGGTAGILGAVGMCVYYLNHHKVD